MMKCSVVILNWNGENWLRQFLPSVVRNTTDDGCEVVVADNCSTDGSVALVRAEFPSVRLLLFDKNYGFAEGYNKAVDAIESEYVVLLNSDVEVTEHWLTTLLQFMDANSQVAAVQPKILSWKSKQTSPEDIKFEHAGAAGGEIDVLGYPYCRGRLMTHIETDHGQYDTPKQVFWTTGACMLIRTDVYKKEGGLDGSFFAHMEEIDLCWRLNCRGYELWCLPESKVYHVGGGALGYENPQKTYLNFRNSLLTLYKNMPANRLWWVMICRFVLDYTAALQMLCTGHPLNARAVIRARMDFLRMRKCYSQCRRHNKLKAVNAFPTTISWRSIVLDFYIRRMCN